MIIGYIRVSTVGQAREGNSLEHQEKLLKENGAAEIYRDVYSGAKNDRPQLKLLLSKIGEGDTLLITRLDRIARSVKEGIELIEELNSKGITVNVLNLGVMSNTATGQLIRNVLLSIAQFERSIILERVSEGKAIAKLNPDFKEGRPRLYTDKQINHALNLLDKNTYKEVVALTGISKGTLINARKKRIKKELEADGIFID